MLWVRVRDGHGVRTVRYVLVSHSSATDNPARPLKNTASVTTR